MSHAGHPGKWKAAFIAVLCLLFAVPGGVRSQCASGMGGREFWLMFLETYDYESVYSIVAATTESTSITVENLVMNWSMTVDAEANTVVSIPLPVDMARSFADGYVSSVGFHVTSEKDIVLYASSFRDYSFDMTALLPAESLDSVYMVQTLMESLSARFSPLGDGYGMGEMVGIVATEDSTVVTMVPPCDLNYNYLPFHYAGDTIRVTLMRGQTIQVSTLGGLDVGDFVSHSLSGMRIVSNGKPIAVFQGNKCAYVNTSMEEYPHAASACDHVYEQTIPTRYWGQKFVVVSTFRYTIGSDVVEVTSSEDDCLVSLNGSVIDTIMAGETSYIELRQHVPDNDSAILAYLVETSRPSSVFLYTGNGVATLDDDWDGYYDGAVGDPSSVYIPPVEQGLSASRFQTVNTPATNSHFVNIVARTTDTADVLCDGQPVRFTATDWGYCFANVEVPEGVHTIESAHGRFQAFVYGRGDAECYAYVASMAMHDMQNLLLADGMDVRMMVQDIEKCKGDTTFFTLRSDSPGHTVEWLVDGLPTGVVDSVFNLVGESSGWVRVDAVVDGMCDTLTAYVNVLGDTVHIDTAICDGTPFVCGDYVFSQSGEYVERISGESCRFLHVSLQLIQAPSVDVDVLPDCSTGVTTLTVSVESDDDLQLWWCSVPDGYVPAGMENMSVLTVNPPQPTEYRVSVMPGVGCFVGESVTVAPMRPTNARLVVSPERLMPDDFNLTVRDVSLGCDRREWFIDGILMPDVGETLVYNFSDRADSITVSLVIWNGLCSDTAQLVIPVRSYQLWAPNVFTPSKDDNAIFAIVTHDIIQVSLDIFDRHGLLVFHSDNPSDGWDGTHNGTSCQQGSYVWHLRYRLVVTPQSEKMATGAVMLLR